MSSPGKKVENNVKTNGATGKNVAVEGSSSASSDEHNDSSSSSSSWGDATPDSERRQRISGSFQGARGRLFSFDEHSRESSCEEVDPHDAATEAASVPTDQERQLLLLMLLAQVCALHDPTPRTFTVHVLELFERGLLDRNSIHFLFDLGLVPSSSPTALLPPNATASTNNNGDVNHVSSAIIAHPERTFRSRRSMEASAIRNKLETLERQAYSRQQTVQSDPGVVPQSNSPRPWSVEAHPLSLSRYQREFDQVGLLASGAFGQVFQATNKMDGRDYAVKRVAFSAQGYSKDSVQQVVREVHCLAVCNHPNVVRYFTSWLEPSWMTGSGRNHNNRTTGDAPPKHQKLLTDIQRMVCGDDGAESLSDDLRDYFKDPTFERSKGGGHRRRFSLESFCADSLEPSPSEYSEWTVDQEFSRDDSFVGRRRVSSMGLGKDRFGSFKHKLSARPQPAENDKYSYQICLFIQMQLCHPKTLADWIRERNNEHSDDRIEHRIEAAAQVFTQVASGLAHVHQNGIVHRDLKPANCFACIEDGFTFKIGDFGLSKLIESASQRERSPSRRGSLSSVRPQPLLLEFYGADTCENFSSTKSSWTDPLTAGVGTASYAAPEQVSSRSYGTEADIFSLGLILLELLCCFSTEHERLQTFRDCRDRRVLPDEFKAFPLACKTILSCTERDPRRRPSAASLTLVDIRQEQAKIPRRKAPPLRLSSQELLERSLLEEQLAEKDEALVKCRRELEEKDRIIGHLRRQLKEQDRSSDPATVTIGLSPAGDDNLVEPASSSSEDEL